MPSRLHTSLSLCRTRPLEKALQEFLGLSSLTTAPAVELSETGEWVGVYPARDISVLIADFKEQAVAGVEVLEEGLGDCVPFVEESGSLFPLASHLVVFSSTWATGIEGDRGAGYYTAEEQAPSRCCFGEEAQGSRRSKKATYGRGFGGAAVRDSAGLFRPSLRRCKLWPRQDKHASHPSAKGRSLLDLPLQLRFRRQ